MNRKRGRPRLQREIKVTPVRHDEIDVRRLARALIALVQAEKNANNPEHTKEEQPDETP